jgi:hypothetical protein
MVVEVAMRIEGRRLLELALHVNLASEAMIAAARNLASLRPADPSAAQTAAWAQAVEGLTLMNLELGSMERILRHATRPAPRARKPRPLR